MGSLSFPNLVRFSFFMDNIKRYLLTGDGMCLGIPAKVIELYETNGLEMAKVDFGGVIKEACMEYLPEVKLGDYVIVHVGFGLSILDEQEAIETLDLLKQIDAVGEEG